MVTFRQWILDSIAAVGTPAALRFIKEKFKRNEMTVVETTQVMIASVHMVTATRETLNIYKVRLSRRECVSDERRRVTPVSLFS